MSYCKINGTDFSVSVAISSYEEDFEVKDGPNFGESQDTGRIIRDVLGCFVGHTITFYAKSSAPADIAAFDTLWQYLKTHSVDDSVMLEAADGQTTIAYEAYYKAAKRTLRKETESGSRVWQAMTVSFKPIYPQIVPT